jgi:hypothetical protein
MTRFDGVSRAHAHVIDMFACAEVKAIPGGRARESTEDFAERMAKQSREALKTKDWGTT